MTDPRNPVQDAIAARLASAGIVVREDPDQHDTPPYTTIGDMTWNPGPITTKSTEGAEVTHEAVSWSASRQEAIDKASVGLAALTDRDNPFTVAGWNLSNILVDFGGPVIKDDSGPTFTYFGVPYRIRIWVWI